MTTLDLTAELAPQLGELDDVTLDKLAEAVTSDINKRAVIASAEARQSELNQDVLNAEGIRPGDPWRQPTGAHNAYPQGWPAEHPEGSDRMWESLINGNVHEPGVSGWRETVQPGEVAVWVQPSGAHDAYTEGDRVVWPEGGPIWVNVHPGVRTNTWEPGVYGWEQEA